MPNLRQLLIMIASAAAVASTVPMTIAATWLPSSLRLSSERAETIASIHCHDPGEMPLFVLEDIFGANGLVFLVASCVITATYVTVVFCARRVCTEVSKLRRQLTTQSALTGHNIQRQLNYALTFQVRLGIGSAYAYTSSPGNDSLLHYCAAVLLDAHRGPLGTGASQQRRFGGHELPLLDSGAQRIRRYLLHKALPPDGSHNFSLCLNSEDRAMAGVAD